MTECSMVPCGECGGQRSQTGNGQESAAVRGTSQPRTLANYGYLDRSTFVVCLDLSIDFIKQPLDSAPPDELSQDDIIWNGVARHKEREREKGQVCCFLPFYGL